MASSGRDLALIRRFQASQRRTTARVGTAFATTWDSLDAYDRNQIDTFDRKVSPYATAAKVAAVAAAVALYGELTGRRGLSVSPRAVGSTFNPEAPFLAMWHAYSMGRPYEEAVAAGRSIAESTAGDYVISSARRTGDTFADQSGLKIRYWNRETDAGACDWCQQVSTQTYTTAETADFGHKNCGCTPIPIYE